VRDLPDAQKDARMRSSLLALGYDEAISLTFISKEDAQRFSQSPALQLENPLSEEASVMRTSLVPGMLNMLAYNLNRGSENVQLFETGKTYVADGEKSVERKCLVMAATGAIDAGVVRGLAPGTEPRPLSFFDLKGDVEALLGHFGYWELGFEAKAAEYYHPGRSARAMMDGAVVAQLGQIDPGVTAARKLKQDVFIAEIYLDKLYEHELRQVRYEALPRFPAVERDFSFVFADAVEFEQIRARVLGLGISELRAFRPVEIFRGEKVGTGKYSVLLRAKFQSAERTLKDDEVVMWASQMTQALEGLGGTQRA
jgi:phenylalanyl-tRNA synthetase beta chain